MSLVDAIVSTLIVWFLELEHRYDVFWGNKIRRRRVYRLPFGLMVKRGDTSGAAEGDAIRYVRKHTSIPTPRVYASVIGYGDRFLLMERIDADNLHGTWDTLSDASRAKIVAQLRGYIAQLRTLRSPHGPAVCGVWGESLCDLRISSGTYIGPFADEAAFNDRIVREACEMFSGIETPFPEVRTRMRDDHKIVFTHGDIAPRNILVRGDDIVSIIDWEQAGWFPEHWEGLKAMWCPPTRGEKEWLRAVPDMFETDYTEDWRVDGEISQYLVGAI